MTLVQEKAEACLQALYTLMFDVTTSPQAISKTLRSQIGTGWTWVSAIQWLTGKDAAEFFDRQPPDGSIGGIPMTAVPLFVVIAKETSSALGRQRPDDSECARQLRALGKQLEAKIAQGKIKHG